MEECSSIVTDILVQKRKDLLLGSRHKRALLFPIPTRRSSLDRNEREAASSIPIEVLAKEWLEQEEADPKLKIYLVKKLLPTLVIGLEKLLNEVTLRNLAECVEMQEDFNPINYLAQFLMRNNPRYGNQLETHPYYKSMKQVAEEMKQWIFSLEGEKLQELRELSMKRLREREERKAAAKAEDTKKIKILEATYDCWLLPGEESVPLADMKVALESCVDVVEDEAAKQQMHELLASLSNEDVDDALWHEGDYISAMMNLDMSGEDFQELVTYLGVCGTERKRRIFRYKRSVRIGSVFEKVVAVRSNSMDRLHLLYLLTSYYDSQSPKLKELVKNPRQWPIMELTELEDQEEQQVFTGTLTSHDVMAFMEQEEEESLREDGGRGSGYDKDKSGQTASESVLAETTSTSSAQLHQLSTASSQPRPHSSASPQLHPLSSTPPQSHPHSSTSPQIRPPSSPQSRPPSSTSPQLRPPSPASPSMLALLEKRLPACSAEQHKSLKRLRRSTCVNSPTGPRPSGPGGSWDHEQLSKSQFTVLMEQFLGPEPQDLLVDAVLHYIGNYYTETLEDRNERLEQRKAQVEVLARRHYLEQLFHTWDNSHSGYISVDELQLVLSKWKGSAEEVLSDQHAKEILGELGVRQGRLSWPHFYSFMSQLTTDMDANQFESLDTFLKMSVNLTREEEQRSAQRRRWLDRLLREGKTSSLKMNSTLQTAVSIIHKDVVAFGGGKDISVLISFLQQKSALTSSHSRVGNTLCVEAASRDVEMLVLGSTIQRDSDTCVSFSVVDMIRPVHVPSIQTHGKVHFYIPKHATQEYNGSMVVVPIEMALGPVVGVVSVDSLQVLPPPVEGIQQTMPASFEQHEALFYQGVGQCVGEVHHWVTSRKDLLNVCLSALRWIHSHCPTVKRGDVYLVTEAIEEKVLGKEEEKLQLHLMTKTSPTLPPATNINQLVPRQNNPFQEHVFVCADTSEPFSADVYGQNHLSFPIRDYTGCAAIVIDLTTHPGCALDTGQLKDVTKVLGLVTTTFGHLNQPMDGGEVGKEVEDDQSEQSKIQQQLIDRVRTDKDIGTVFDELILCDLKTKMQRLDNMVFAELRSYVEPPQLVLQVMRVLFTLLYPKRDCETWKQCRMLISVSMVRAMKNFDPLKIKSHPKMARAKALFAEIPRDSVYRHSSLPTKFIFTWLRACLPILEHTISTA